jgi:hypothetical protein
MRRLSERARDYPDGAVHGLVSEVGVVSKGRTSRRSEGGPCGGGTYILVA